MLHTRRTTAWTSHAYTPGQPVRIAGRAPDLCLVTLGRFFSTGRFDFQQMSPLHAIHVVAAGRGLMRVRGRPYAVEAGDVFTFFPGQLIQYHDAPRTPWRYTWFNLAGRGVTAALAEAGITPAHPHRQGDWASRLEPLFQEIVAAFDQPAVTPLVATSLGWRLVEALGRREAAPGPGPRPGSLAAAARFLMDQHFHDGITIAEIAVRLGASRSTLFRHFRGEFRIGPKGYLNALRLELARKLLRQSDSGLKGIAAACGYNSLAHFVRAFHKAFGRPPGRWRRT